MCEALARGEELPFDPTDATIYYVGPTPAKPGKVIVPVTSTLSPACKVFASSSVNGNVIFLAAILDHLRFVTCYMAVDVNCTWHTCNVCW